MKVLRLSHSAVEKFNLCPRKWYLDRVEGIRAHREDESNRLRIGDCFHKALEVWWGNRTAENRLTLAEEKLREQAHRQALSNDELAVASILLTAYDALYAEEAAAYNDVRVEQRVVVPVLRPDGTVDPELELKIIHDNEVHTDEGSFGIEHKTTAKEVTPWSTYWDRVKSNQQVDIYFIVAQDAGNHLDHLVYDVVRAPPFRRFRATPVDKREFYKKNCKWGKAGEPRPGTRLEDESFDEFVGRVQAEVLAKPDEFFARVKLYPDEPSLESTRYDLWATGRQMLNALQQNSFPRNRQGCRAYGQLCEYHPVCFEGCDPVKRTDLYRIRKTPPVLEDRP